MWGDKVAVERGEERGDNGYEVSKRKWDRIVLSLCLEEERED